MKRAMIDTDVLIHGTRPRHPKDSEAARDKARDCKALLMTLEEIHVSTITATEFLPYMKVGDEALARTVLDKLRRLAFDAAAEREAVRLITKLRRDPARCRMCLGPKTGAPCKECKNSLGRGPNLNDIYIVSTAVVADSVDVLYSYDVLHLDGHVSSLKIARPPNSNGDLFERVAAAAVPEDDEKAG